MGKDWTRCMQRASELKTHIENKTMLEDEIQEIRVKCKNMSIAELERLITRSTKTVHKIKQNKDQSCDRMVDIAAEHNVDALRLAIDGFSLSPR
ncbi:hypothetical protein L596_012798 [Steinernema carpocapsae]|uniref:Uncharacterized protein n=1 Tax=Steinernema carpocapsae TaxID=34508 RepID=A0A4U5NYB0_STECR|nr:hypothetical protein L596_012798 [Steinernema carpocapsae]